MSKLFRKFTLLALLTYSTLFAASSPYAQYWNCIAIDESNQEWAIQNPYQLRAINLALAACKKASNTPLTCKVSKSNCEKFVNGVSVASQWQCNALDALAMTWRGNAYPQADDAALAAKDCCKQNSAAPATCYTYRFMCHNTTLSE